MHKATFVKEILVDDPDENVLTTVSLSIYKHENGMLFAVDSQYLEKWHEAAYPLMPDLYTGNHFGVSDDAIILNRKEFK